MPTHTPDRHRLDRLADAARRGDVLDLTDPLDKGGRAAPPPRRRPHLSILALTPIEIALFAAAVALLVGIMVFLALGLGGRP